MGRVQHSHLFSIFLRFTTFRGKLYHAKEETSVKYVICCGFGRGRGLTSTFSLVSLFRHVSDTRLSTG